MTNFSYLQAHWPLIIVTEPPFTHEKPGHGVNGGLVGML